MLTHFGNERKQTRKVQIEEKEERRKAEQEIAEAYHLDLMRKVREILTRKSVGKERVYENGSLDLIRFGIGHFFVGKLMPEQPCQP